MHGNLNVSIHRTGEEAFLQGIIRSNKTKNIFIDVDENDIKDVAQNLVIYGSDVQESIQINMLANFRYFTLYCPLERGTKCILNCVDNIGNDMCKEGNIYTRYGMINNLEFSFLLFSLLFN